MYFEVQFSFFALQDYLPPSCSRALIQCFMFLFMFHRKIQLNNMLYHPSLSHAFSDLFCSFQFLSCSVYSKNIVMFIRQIVCSNMVSQCLRLKSVCIPRTVKLDIDMSTIQPNNCLCRIMSDERDLLTRK